MAGSTDKPSRTIARNARTAWQKNHNKPPAKTATKPPGTPRSASQQPKDTFNIVQKGKHSTPREEAEASPNGYNPKSIEQAQIQPPSEKPSPKLSPQDKKMLAKKEEKELRKKLKKEKRLKRQKTEKEQKRIKDGSPLTGTDVIKHVQLKTKKGESDTGGKVSKKRKSSSQKETIKPEEEQMEIEAEYDTMLEAKTNAEDNQVEEPEEQIESEIENGEQEKESSKQKKKKKKKTKSELNSKETPLKEESPIVPKENNSSVQQNSTQTATQTETPSKKKKHTPSKTPTQKTTLHNFYPTPSSTKATPSPDKTSNLTHSQTKEIFNEINDIESSEAVQHIYNMDAAESDNGGLFLKLHHIQKYTPFQQTQIMITLVYNAAVEHEPELDAEKFCHYILEYDIPTLIRYFNHESKLLRLIKDINNSTVNTITERDFAPAYYDNLFGYALQAKIDENPDNVRYMLDAIKETFERFYSYRSDNLLEIIEKCSAEDVDAIFNKPGTIVDLIQSKGVIAQFRLPKICPALSKPRLLPSQHTRLFQPYESIKLDIKRFGKEKTKSQLRGQIVQLIRDEEPDFSAKINQVLTTYTLDRLKELVQQAGTLYGIVEHVKKKFPNVGNVSLASGLNQAPGRYHNPYAKTTSTSTTKPITFTPATNSALSTTTENVTQNLQNPQHPQPIANSQYQFPYSNEPTHTYFYGQSGYDATNDESIQTIFVQQDITNKMIPLLTPAKLLKEVVDSVVKCAKKTTHSAVLRPWNDNAWGRELYAIGQFPSDEILETDYMFDIRATPTGISFKMKLCLSFSYLLLRIASPNNWKWQRNKLDHLETLAQKGIYTAFAKGANAKLLNAYKKTVAIIGSSLVQDPDRHRDEFIQLVKEQTSISIDPKDITVQFRELNMPSHFVPTNDHLSRDERLNLTDEERLIYLPELMSMYCIMVKDSAKDEVIHAVEQLQINDDRIRYPTSHGCKYVVCTSDHCDSREKYRATVFKPQQEYYDNRLQVMINGLPSDLNLHYHVPQILIKDGETNALTFESLITGEITLAHREKDNSPMYAVFTKLCKGRTEGSYVLESTRYQQADFYELCSKHLQNILQNWLHDIDTSKLYITFESSRGSIFTGMHKYPISTIVEDTDVPEFPLVYDHDLARPPAPPNPTHLNTTGQRQDGTMANRKEITTPYSYYGPQHTENTATHSSKPKSKTSKHRKQKKKKAEPPQQPDPYVLIAELQNQLNELINDKQKRKRKANTSPPESSDEESQTSTDDPKSRQNEQNTINLTQSNEDEENSSDNDTDDESSDEETNNEEETDDTEDGTDDDNDNDDDNINDGDTGRDQNQEDPQDSDSDSNQHHDKSNENSHHRFQDSDESSDESSEESSSYSESSHEKQSNDTSKRYLFPDNTNTTSNNPTPKIEVYICNKCGLVSANDALTARLHENCCNGNICSSLIFNCQTEITDHYLYNPTAVADQFKIKRYVTRNNGVFDISLYSPNSIQDVRLISQCEPNPMKSIVYDPIVYELYPSDPRKAGDAILYLDSGIMKKATVAMAQHPNYTVIEPSGKMIDLSAVDTPIHAPIKMSDTHILTHHSFYPSKHQRPFSPGQNVMYDTGKEFLRTTKILQAKHPNYVIEDTDGSSKFVTIDALHHPALANTAYVLENKQFFTELELFGNAVEDAKREVGHNSSMSKIQNHIENSIDQMVEKYTKSTPVRQMDMKIDKVIDDINNSYYEEEPDINIVTPYQRDENDTPPSPAKDSTERIETDCTWWYSELENRIYNHFNLKITCHEIISTSKFQIQDAPCPSIPAGSLKIQCPLHHNTHLLLCYPTPDDTMFNCSTIFPQDEEVSIKRLIAPDSWWYSCTTNKLYHRANGQFFSHEHIHFNTFSKDSVPEELPPDSYQQKTPNEEAECLSLILDKSIFQVTRTTQATASSNTWDEASINSHPPPNTPTNRSRISIGNTPVHHNWEERDDISKTSTTSAYSSPLPSPSPFQASKKTIAASSNTSTSSQSSQSNQTTTGPSQAHLQHQEYLRTKYAPNDSSDSDSTDTELIKSILNDPRTTSSKKATPKRHRRRPSRSIPNNLEQLQQIVNKPYRLSKNKL